MDIAISWNWQQRITIDARVTTLIESVNFHIESLVLSNYPLCVFIGVERIHQHKWHVGVVRSVQVLTSDNIAHYYQTLYKKKKKFIDLVIIID